MNLEELEKIAVRIRKVMRIPHIVWGYGHVAPDLPAQNSIALRILTIMHGKIVKAGETKTYIKEMRPYRGNTTPEYATDPEPAYKLKSHGSDNIYVDLALRLEWQMPEHKGMLHSVVVSSPGEFTTDQGFCVLFRNEGHLKSLWSNELFRNAIIDEFGLMDHLARLREEFTQVRGVAFAQSRSAAETHGKRIEKSRARAEKPEVLAKKADKSRALAREKISTELIKGRLGKSFKQFTPEQFFEMYKITRDAFPALSEIASWQNRNPTASKEVTLEDIVQAYELAQVKDVMQS